MLRRSSFVRAAVGKPWYTYLRTLATCAPLHWVGLLGAAVLAVRLLLAMRNALVVPTRDEGAKIREAKDISRVKITPAQSFCLQWLPVLALAAWPVSFLAALTLIGSLGSGFQSRFLSPMLPGSTLLVAVLLDAVSQRGNSNSSMRVLASCCGAVTTTASVYSALHVFYNAVLYAPLFADLDVSVVDVVASVLHSVYAAPESRESFQATLRFMAHYGLVRQAQ